MRRNTGAAAVLAVVFAILGISYLPRKGAESQTAAQEARKPSRTPPSQLIQQGASETCTTIKARLDRFISNPRLPDSCYGPARRGKPAKGLLKNPNSELKFAIALVPNPITTHLQLMTDALIEAVQQAAQDDNYSYEGSWLPWDDTSKDYALLADQQRADELKGIQEQQPGVLIFRRELSSDTDGLPYPSGLIVFLVGEQPTRGISDKQFENALAWISTLGGSKPVGSKPLRILGPTFSGSLPSLARALKSETNRVTVGEFHNLQVFSGSVSSGPYVHWFSAFLKGLSPLTFQTTQESDDLILERFLGYIHQAGYPLRNVAILSEDDTAFGQTADLASSEDGELKDSQNCPAANYRSCAIHLYYPRDIASLRSAYEQQGIFGAGQQAPGSNAAGSTLRGDLSEPANSGHDTVRTYGGQLTPLAQESVLLRITEILRDRNIEFVILRSTNPLNQIFLSQFLERGYPSGRIVLDGADLLFSRGAEGASLRGVMMLSTYPLIEGEQDWTPSVGFKANGTYRVFGIDVAEGTYIAARQLFGLDPSQAVPIHDYAPPQWTLREGGTQPEEQRPPTWLSVVGHRRLWPLAVLNARTLPESKFSSLLQPWKNEGDGKIPPLAFIGETTALLVLCLFWAGWHLFCCWRGSIQRPLLALVSFSPVSGREQEHRQLILGGCALLAVLSIIIGSSLGLFSRWWEARGGWPLAMWTLGMLAMSFAACILNYRLPVLENAPPSEASPQKPSRAGHAIIAMTIITVVYALGVWVLLFSRLNLANEVPLYWRNANLFGGVSPLLPQVLLIAGLYGWFWFNLKGLALLGDDRPRLPSETDLLLPQPPPSADASAARLPPKEPGWIHALQVFSQEKAGTPLEDLARPLTVQYGVWLIVFFVVTAVFISLALRNRALRTLGDLRFGWMMFFWLSLYMAVVLADMLQLFRSWKQLRELLISLDRLVLRRTLNALQGLSWGSVLSMSENVLEERYRVMSRQFESLRHLLNIIHEWMPAGAEEAEARKAALNKLEECHRSGQTFVAWYTGLKSGKRVSSIEALKAFEIALASTAGLVLTRLLVPAWQKEKLSLLLDQDRIHGKAEGEREPGEKGQTGHAIPLEAIEAYVPAAEEFFVLPYLGFIQNALGRIRTIVLGSLCVFISATLAVASYPFEPLPVLGGAFLLLFVVSGAALVVVYAEMHRDATLSHVTNTTPGELGGHFWLQLFAFGIGPLLGLLTALFPSITDFVVSWIQPGAQAIK